MITPIAGEKLKTGEHIKFSDYNKNRTLKRNQNKIARITEDCGLWADFEFIGTTDTGTVFYVCDGTDRGSTVIYLDEVYKVNLKETPEMELPLELNNDPLSEGTALQKMPRKKKEETRALPAGNATPIADRFINLLGEVDQQVSERINQTVGTQLDELNTRVRQALDDIDKTRKLEVVIGDESHVVEGTQHKCFEKLLKVAQLRQNALIVGMAGTGKTHAAEQVAEALGKTFYTMSVGAQTSKSDIIGYMNANGGYNSTHFRAAYQQGGVFLMDEIDAGNANVLIQVNAALSNGQLAFPDAMVKRHRDFVFIASANTYGTGMNRQYVGRNQLDAATLDRFTIVNWDIDEDLEKQLSQDNGKWLHAVRQARSYINAHNIRALITPRATQKGAALLRSGFTLDEVIAAVMLGTVPEDKHPEFIAHVTQAFNGS